MYLPATLSRIKEHAGNSNDDVIIGIGSTTSIGALRAREVLNCLQVETTRRVSTMN